MNWVPLNFALLKNPFNWVIVTLMIVIAGLALHLFFNEGAEAPKTAEVDQ